MVDLPSVTVSALAVIIAVICRWFYLYYTSTSSRKVLPNPLKANVPNDPRLIYQPTTLPGARDVNTPYGSIRVYEWGPVDGPKVLFVHGISTPCIVFERCARSLAARGCRVMLFDLFGRGLSDGVGDLPHDDRLYTSQMLMALASSPLAWTGDGGFHLVGYSMGGGIAVSFATAFPRLVKSLSLIAPAGLIRPENFGFLSRFLFQSGVIPDFILERLVRIRLRTPLANSVTPKTSPGSGVSAPLDVHKDIRKANAPSLPVSYVQTSPEKKGSPSLLEDIDLATVDRYCRDYINWMTTHHAGFVSAFMSSVRFAPLQNQHENWARLADRDPHTTCIILGAADVLIQAEDYRRDVPSVLYGTSTSSSEEGPVLTDHIRWRELPGDHDFIVTHAHLIVDELCAFWRHSAMPEN